MDPVTAIGLASGILAFVEISAKIISGTLEVARSGSLAENAHVGAIVDDLQQAAGELQERLPDHSRHAESLNGLASECRSVADELQELLQKLKVDCGSPKWNAIKVTIHSMRKRGDVAQLEGRLEKCRSQILLRLMMILDERQTSVQVQLSGIESKSASRSANIVHQLDRLRHDILSATENQKNNHGRSEENSKDSDQSILLQKLSTSVDALLDGSRGPSPDVRVLKQLYFPGVYSREDNMETASDRTFRWILEDGFDERLGEDDLKSGDNGRNSAGDNFEDPEDTRSDKSEKEKPATHMKKKERGETDEEKQRRIAKENRVKARAKFTTWLERDSGVFHISGKPGSGKSTLMKFIHGQPETIERLIVWAGNKQLVFGHFFFFKAGGKLQKSLEGLQRSILFEALKQCPELIKHVFSEAYRAFSSNPAASSIDELYFRPRELDQAINMLASVPTAMRYRICFFIDGLDEYEDTNADELHHERLAEQLCSWATNSDVKILVSSRPYRAFQEAFLDERRIRIQDLTDIDITLFARKMFEEDKSFDQVRPYYQRLVNKVVQDSAGVFLWARLTMRSLIMATRRNCSPEFLEQQLDQTPRSINALYAQLLASINPIDRDSAYRLLLFVARLAEADVEVLALALTWMDSLENPNFPMCSEPRAYTTEEVELRRNSVRQDLENCTKGLLEITTHTDSSCRSTTDTVRFFHRTILDFVRESEVFRQVSAKYPGLGDEKMTIRMFLAELWYIKIPHRRHELLNRHFGRMPPSQTRDNYLDALERVVSYHNANGTISIGIATHHPYGYSHMYRQQTSSQMYRTKASFLHWAASILDDPEYVIKKLKEKPHLLHHRDYLSLVLSATFSNETRWSDTRLTPFFQLGISPNERINVYKISFRRELLSPKSCWAVFCTFYAMHNTGRLCESDRACYLATQLEDFLSTGEVDINCVILLNTCGDAWRWRYHDDEPEPKEPGVTHYIYLKDLISRLSSDNHVAISHLVSASNWSLWKSLKNIWSYSPPPENDLSALTSTYPVCDDELLFSKETHVVSLVWENEKIERTDFEITLY